MKVLLYGKNQKLLSKSGIGRAMQMQRDSLEENGVEVTTNPEDDWDIVHLNSIFPSDYQMAQRAKKADKAQIPGQVEMYHKYNDLIREGIIIGLTLPGRTISMIAGRWYHQGGEGIRSEYLLLAFQPFLGRCI